MEGTKFQRWACLPECLAYAGLKLFAGDAEIGKLDFGLQGLGCVCMCMHMRTVVAVGILASGDGRGGRE